MNLFGLIMVGWGISIILVVLFFRWIKRLDPPDEEEK